MRARVAKSGTIHIQESMFTTDARDEMEAPAQKTTPASQAYTITFGQVYNAVLDAYRAGEPPEAIEVTTAGGYAVHPKFARIIDANNGQRYDWQEVHDAAHTIYLAESRPDAPMPDRLAPPRRAAGSRHLPCDLPAGIGVDVGRAPQGSKPLGSRGCLSR